MSHLGALLRFALAMAALSVSLIGCDTGNVEPPVEPTAGVTPQSPTSVQRPYVAEQSGPIVLSGGASNRVVGAPEVVLGTGEFVNPQINRASAGGAALTGSDVTLDFANVDVRDVLKSVL